MRINDNNGEHTHTTEEMTCNTRKDIKPRSSLQKYRNNARMNKYNDSFVLLIYTLKKNLLFVFDPGFNFRALFEKLRAGELGERGKGHDR